MVLSGVRTENMVGMVVTRNQRRRKRKMIRSPCLVRSNLRFFSCLNLTNLLHLLAIDALALDYNVKFPLSLVISRKTILRYQLLFRFLLHLKHVEQQLTAMWADHKSSAWRTPVPTHTEFERWRTRVFILRARMLAFVQQ